jgi:hypothetical protein
MRLFMSVTSHLRLSWVPGQIPSNNLTHTAAATDTRSSTPKIVTATLMSSSLFVQLSMAEGASIPSRDSGGTMPTPSSASLPYLR